MYLHSQFGTVVLALTQFVSLKPKPNLPELNISVQQLTPVSSPN